MLLLLPRQYPLFYHFSHQIEVPHCQENKLHPPVQALWILKLRFHQAQVLLAKTYTPFYALPVAVGLPYDAGRNLDAFWYSSRSYPTQPDRFRRLLALQVNPGPYYIKGTIGGSAVMQVVPAFQANFTPVGVFPLYHFVRRPPGGRVFERKTLAVFARPPSLSRRRRRWLWIENSVLTKPGYYPAIQAFGQAEETIIAVFAVAGHDVEGLLSLQGAGLVEFMNLEGSYLQCYLAGRDALSCQGQGPTGSRFRHVGQGGVGISCGYGTSVYGSSGLVDELAGDLSRILLSLIHI